jgi:hypothetical protein
MKNQFVGIAMLLLGIIIALIPGGLNQLAWIVALFLGLVGLIMVIANSGNKNDDSKNNKNL